MRFCSRIWTGRPGKGGFVIGGCRRNATRRVLAMGASVELTAARTPRTLWIELTSKCPLDCIFCSRKMRRGAGEHLPFGLYEELIGDLSDPRRILLNYSGESTGYPKLIPAIKV